MKYDINDIPFEIINVVLDWYEMKIRGNCKDCSYNDNPECIECNYCEHGCNFNRKSLVEIKRMYGRL